MKLPTPIKTLFVSLACIIFSALIKYATMYILNRKALEADLLQPLAVGFELIVLSWAILGSAFYSSNKTSNLRKKAFLPLFISIGLFLLSLVIVIILTLTIKSQETLNLLVLIIPNIIGMIAVALATDIVIRHS